MSSRTLLILFIVLVVVAGIVILMNRQEETGEADEPLATLPPTPDTRQFLEGVEMQAVGRLDIRDQTTDQYASFLREPDGGWFQTHPTQTLVISSTVNSSVSGLLNLTSRRTLAEGENPLVAYGLEEPGREIVLIVQREDGSSVRHTFFIGNEIPAGGAYYLQKQGLPNIYIVPSFSIDTLFELITDPPIPTPVPPITGTVPITP